MWFTYQVEKSFLLLIMLLNYFKNIHILFFNFKIDSVFLLLYTNNINKENRQEIIRSKSQWYSMIDAVSNRTAMV